jgi:uncharacterized protein YndB with AHSA1/START domain
MEVRREVELTAEPEEVWEALTSPERLEEWFANDVELDAIAGGDGVFRWDSGEVRHATVTEVVEGERFAFRWWDEEAPGEPTLVTIAVEPLDIGSRVVVTETLPRPQACASGWATALELRFALVAV